MAQRSDRAARTTRPTKIGRQSRFAVGTGLIVAAASVGCGSTDLPLEGPIESQGQAGGSSVAAGANSAGGGRTGTGGGTDTASGDSSHGGVGGTDGGGTAVVLPPPLPETRPTSILIHGENFGQLSAAQFVGDLDGDGYDELAVLNVTQAGPPSATQLDAEGALYVFYGRRSFPKELSVLDADFIIVGLLDLSAMPGDLDGDGYDDLAFLGQCYYSPACPTDGIHIVYGGPERLTGIQRSDTLGIQWTTARAGSRYYTVAQVGDVNGDGRADLLLAHGVPKDNAGFSVELVFGRSDRTTQFPTPGFSDATFTGTTGTNETYFHLEAPGDVDGDGYADILISTRSTNMTGGTVNLFYGGPARFYGTYAPGNADAILGSGYWPLGTLGDLDQDGIDDFGLLTSFFDDVALASRAQLAVVYGRAERFSGRYAVSDVADFVLDTPVQVDGASAGDVNGDGQLDLVVGAASAADGLSVVGLFLGDGNRWTGEVSVGPPYDYYEGQSKPDDLYTPLGTTSAADGDWNADGAADVAVIQTDGFLEPGSVRVLLGQRF